MFPWLHPKAYCTQQFDFAPWENFTTSDVYIGLMADAKNGAVQMLFDIESGLDKPIYGGADGPATGAGPRQDPAYYERAIDTAVSRVLTVTTISSGANQRVFAQPAGPMRFGTRRRSDHNEVAARLAQICGDRAATVVDLENGGRATGGRHLGGGCLKLNVKPFDHGLDAETAPAPVTGGCTSGKRNLPHHAGRRGLGIDYRPNSRRITARQSGNFVTSGPCTYLTSDFRPAASAAPGASGSATHRATRLSPERATSRENRS